MYVYPRKDGEVLAATHGFNKGGISTISFTVFDVELKESDAPLPGTIVVVVSRKSAVNVQDRQIGELSGGQQQRTFLARALAQKADILMLDEPFVGVDIPTEEKIIAVLRSLSEAGKTLLVVHHDLQAVPEYFDHVILLNQRLIAAGPTKEIFKPDTLRQAFGGQLALLQQAGLMGN